MIRSPLLRDALAAVYGLAVGAFMMVLLGVGPSSAATRVVSPGEATLQAALSAALPGDILQLDPGTYRGRVIVDRSISILGPNKIAGEAVVDGGGEGTVIRVEAPGVVVRDLTITNSGISLQYEDSGVFVTKTAGGTLIEGNRLVGNLIGVFLKGPRDARVRDNTIVGRRDLRMNERGNGVQLWNTPGSVVEGNDFRYGRDGIFVTTSKRNVFRANRFRDLRFAMHYMYTNNSEISDNRSFGNHAGYAIMFSHGLKVRGNLSEGDRDRGILLNYANRSQFEDNTVRPGPERPAAEKCVFIYNANKNSFRRNRFEGCDIGIHFTAGSDRNQIYGNAFIANRTQVKYVGTRQIEWSRDGRGNFWSDNLAFDLNGDGIADRPYQPNDLVDQVIWRHPMAKLLLSSPAIQVLRWAQSEFPAIRPGGVTDSAPLMAPPIQTHSREARR